MPKVKLQAEIERIRKLSPVEFVKEQEIDEAKMMQGTKAQSDAEYSRWSLYLAAATDFQMYELAKNEFANNVEEYGEGFFDEYIKELLEQREVARSRFGLKIQDREKGHVIDVNAWMNDIKKLHKMHEGLKENPEIMKNLFRGRDFTPRS